MEAQMLEILNAVQEGTKSPTQAQSELLLLYSVMASATPLLEHLEYKDDTVAQGEWLQTLQVRILSNTRNPFDVVNCNTQLQRTGCCTN